MKPARRFERKTIVIAGDDGRCAICDEPIFAGEQIVLHEDQDWVHVDCEDSE